MKNSSHHSHMTLHTMTNKVMSSFSICSGDYSFLGFWKDLLTQQHAMLYLTNNSVCFVPIDDWQSLTEFDGRKERLWTVSKLFRQAFEYLYDLMQSPIVQWIYSGFVCIRIWCCTPIFLLSQRMESILTECKRLHLLPWRIVALFSFSMYFSNFHYYVIIQFLFPFLFPL